MEQSLTSPLKRFWLLLKPDKSEIRNIYIYAVFYGLVNLSLPIGIQSIINLIQGGQMSTSWIVLIAFVILGVAITGILQVNQLQISENLQQKIFTRAAFEFAYRIPRVKSEEMDKHYAPELMNRFFDVVSVQKGLSKILIDFSTASIQTLFGLILLSFYHPFFIAFSLILIGLVYAIFKFTSRKGLISSLYESKSKYNVAHWLEELARTMVSFKLAGNTELPMNRTNTAVASYIDARDQHFKVLKSQYYLMIMFKVMVAAGLLIVGSILVMEQLMNIGQFVAAEIIILLVLGSVEKLILSLESIYDVITSLEKIGQVTDLELEADEGVNVDHDKDGFDVELFDASFSYPDQTRNIFQSLNLKISSSEKILISGDSDSGKTTLLYLLAGLYKVKTGSLLLNKLPMSDYHPQFLRSNIGDCFMDELLFEGTVLENITMGRENASMDNVLWAIEHLHLNHFIKSLPNGFQTTIKARGKQFSKGVVDKLILARAIVDKPKLLLIKDAFVGMIEEERHEILDFLTSNKQSWTLVIASNDPSLKRRVDRHFLAKNGNLTETK